MNPKQKAEDLIISFRDKLDEVISYDEAKKCAELCIDDNILVIIDLYGYNDFMSDILEEKIQYWNKVKEELKNI